MHFTLVLMIASSMLLIFFLNAFNDLLITYNSCILENQSLLECLKPMTHDAMQCKAVRINVFLCVRERHMSQN